MKSSLERYASSQLKSPMRVTRRNGAADGSNRCGAQVVHQRPSWLSVSLFALSFLVLAGCQERHDWNQKLTVVIDTPVGPVSGSSVVEIRARFGQLPMSASEVNYQIRGEATVVEVAPGRYLFALLGGSEERYYQAVRDELPTTDRGEWLFLIPKMQGVVTIRPNNYPILVTFSNIDNPKTVRRVDPNNIAASFGTAFSLQKITLEITDAPATYGHIKRVLDWINDPDLLKNPTWRNLPSLTQTAIMDLKIPTVASTP